jgi:hypothetical protein
MSEKQLTKRIESHPLFKRLNDCAKKWENKLTDKEYRTMRDFIIVAVIREIAEESR